ncbi:MAG: cob(I)yrinic acid a,c-diamide adenosyltransferase [Candidatus Woesearchaeota archaeon]
MIINLTGNGKGKTTSALGTAFRAMGYGKKVCIIQFMKTENSGEFNFANELKTRLNERILIYSFGSEKLIAKNNDAVKELKTRSCFKKLKIKVKTLEDKKLAKLALKKAHDCLKQKPFLLILDEINPAVYFGLISKRRVLKFLKNSLENSNDTNIILTGRNSPKEFIEISDIVSEIRSVKHYFNNKKSNISAPVKGIDF